MWSWWQSGSNSKKSKELTEAEACFDAAAELSCIQQHVRAAAKAPQDKGSAACPHAALNLAQFVRMCGLEGLEAGFAGQVFSVLSGGNAGITEEQVIIAKARLERMGDRAAHELTFLFLKPNASGVLDGSAVARGLKACTSLALSRTNSPELLRAADWRGIDALIAGVTRHAEGKAGTRAGTGLCTVSSVRIRTDGGAQEEEPSPPKPTLHLDSYCSWCSVCPALHSTLASLLQLVGQVHEAESQPAANEAAGRTFNAACELLPGPSSAPRLLEASGERCQSLKGCLLQPVYAYVLSSYLSPDLRQEWRLLFSSKRNGKSFSTLAGRLAALPGPTLLLLRDAEGYCMGGFAPEPWKKNGTFFGNTSAFIFALEPCFQVFPATGINNNIQWCGIGFSQLPNGLGFGGASGAAGVGHFSLFVDSTLDAGMSRPIATFGNPSLASNQVFKVESVECWLLRLPEEDPYTSKSKGGGSVLSNEQTRNFMEMAGMNVRNSVAEPPIDT